MSENIISDLDLWLGSAAAGFCMAAAYDILRLWRRIVRHGRFAVDLEDLLYWTACFFASFALLHYANNGIVRFAAVLGAAAGMALYIVTIGRVFVPCGYFLIDNTLGRLLRLLCKFFKRLHKIRCYVNQKIWNCLKNSVIFNKFEKISQCRLTGKPHGNKMSIHRGFFIPKGRKSRKKQERSEANAKKKKQKTGISQEKE